LKILPPLTVRRSIATYLAESPAFARLVYACLSQLSAMQEVSFCLSGGLLIFPSPAGNQKTNQPLGLVLEQNKPFAKI
jgi:hypothetical protein